MADISKLTQLVNGAQRQVDLSQNNLIVGSLKVGASSPTQLTQAILNNLINLQNGTDFANGTNSHTHDARYYTQTQVAATGVGSAGSTLVGDNASYTNFTPSAATVKGALSGIDTKLGQVAATNGFDDSLFNIFNHTDNTKKIIFTAAAISTAVSRIITMPDANVNLADVNLAVKTDGSRAFTAAQSHGGFAITNVADPTNPQDAATKNYVDGKLSGVSWKSPVRALAASNTPLTGSAPLVIDGVSLVSGDDVLLTAQTAGADNGIYRYTVSGTYTLARRSDSNSSANILEAAVFVEEGTTYADSAWVNTTNAPITLGTTSLTFVQFSGLGQVVAGNGLSKSGNTLSVVAADASILSNGSGIAVVKDPAGAIILGGSGIKVQLESSNPTLQISANALGAKLDPARAITTGASGIGVNVDNSTIAITANAVQVKNAGVSATQLATGAFDQATITGGAGTAAAVQYAPLVQRMLVAGQSFSANTSYAVRWGIPANGETANRIYAADKNAATANNFNCIGIALATGAITSGQSIMVVHGGTYTLGSSDTNFATGVVGQEAVVGTSGAVIPISSLANTTNEAAYIIGIIEDVNKIDVGGRHLRGIA